MNYTSKKSNLKNSTILLVAIAVLVGASKTQASMLITGETATHSANDTLSVEFPINAVNNSGITINTPDLMTDGAITHNANTLGDGWVADPTVGTALGVTLTIDFGQVYDVDGMRIWNYNGSGGTDNGIQNYNLETSADNVTYIPRQLNQFLPVAPNAGDIPTDNTYDGVYNSVYWPGTRYVRFTVMDTYRSGDDRAGLSEVMFSAIPEPSTALLLAIGGMLLWRRGRKQG